MRFIKREFDNRDSCDICTEHGSKKNRVQTVLEDDNDFDSVEEVDEQDEWLELITICENCTKEILASFDKEKLNPGITQIEIDK